MTPVFCCGFECGQLGAAGQHWSTGGGSPAISTTTVRSGLRSIRINPSAGSAHLALASGLFTTNKLVVRFYIRFATLPNSTTQLFDNSAVGVFFQSSDNKIYAGGFSGSNQLGATGISVTTGQWYRIDLKIDSSANPWLIDVTVDGVACGQLSFATGASSVGSGSIRMGNPISSTTMDAFYDDIIISTTEGDYPIGEGKVVGYVANADGTHTSTASNILHGTIATPASTAITSATTDAFNWVNARPILGGATDNTRLINAVATAATQYVEVKFEDSVEDRAPRAVEVLSADRQAGTGAGDMTVKIADNGTESTVIARSGTAGTVTDKYVTKQFALAPTGGAWNLSASGNGSFQDIRARFGYSGDANPDQYWRGIMIEAEYDTAPLPTLLPRMMLMGVG
jgi:hypothetical protein